MRHGAPYLTHPVPRARRPGTEQGTARQRMRALGLHRRLLDAGDRHRALNGFQQLIQVMVRLHAMYLIEQMGSKNSVGELNMRSIVALVLAFSTFGLSACVADSTMERAVVGAAIGCAAGKVLVNGRCVEGAIVGAGVGVLTK